MDVPGAAKARTAEELDHADVPPTKPRGDLKSRSGGLQVEESGRLLYGGRVKSRSF